MYNNIYNGKKVLVTGNTGFKGSWLTTWLLELGANVIGLSDKIPTNPAMFEALELAKKIDHCTADVTNFQEVKKIVEEKKPDFIFHLAAQAIVSFSYEDPLSTIQTNIMGTACILEALRHYNHSCTVVMITSDKCYDNVEWTWGYRENDRLGGKDPYSASKAGAEIVIHTYYHSFFSDKDSHVKIVSARAGNVIGGGDWAPSRIVPDCIRAWSQGKAVIIRRPASTRPWQHVLEPISGYLTLGKNLYQNKQLSGESYNFGPASDQTFMVKQLIDEVALNWTFKKDQQQVIVQEDPGFHEAGLLKLNCDKALHDLKWKPVLGFADAARLTASWYDVFYNQKEKDLYGFTLAQIAEYAAIAKKTDTVWAQ
jgi:CDP-glucose 4,6-dehydratase